MAGKTRIAIQGRSEGDGMENISIAETEESRSYNKPFHQSFVKDYPKNFVTSPEKRKEPKFVPYEPYKAAVSPIINNTNKWEKISVSKHVIDSQKVTSLASSIIKKNSSKELYSNLDKKAISATVSESSNTQTCNSECDQKIRILEDKIKLLEKEKKEILSQFQIQTEVNSDLKKMLIASLGEDMHIKVQNLTEDKARLGMDVLSFSHELRQKNEEIERLSVCCDVWKSKFEASSLMVDDLAGWKVSLTRKLNDAVQALDSLLKEHKLIFDQLCATYSILKYTLVAFDLSAKSVPKLCLPSTSLTYLAAELKNLTVSIQERLLGKSQSNINVALEGSRQYTPAENAATQFLTSCDVFPPVTTSGALTGKKCGPGTVACQILPHVCVRDTTVNCCKHCSGEFKTL